MDESNIISIEHGREKTVLSIPPGIIGDLGLSEGTRLSVKGYSIPAGFREMTEDKVFKVTEIIKEGKTYIFRHIPRTGFSAPGYPSERFHRHPGRRQP